MPTLRLPVPSASYSQREAADIATVLRAAFVPLVSTQEAAPFLLLRSPDGRTWRISVNNAGALVVESYTP